MFMRNSTQAIHEVKSNPKQIKIPEDGQLSKKGTVIKNTDTEQEIDYTIAEMIKKINQAGFQSKFSCSGLKKDHPVKDVKHDGAYISFLHRENDGEALNLIESVASRLNMTVESGTIGQHAALIVRIDKDREGRSLSERIHMANEAVKKRYCTGIKQQQGAYTSDLEAILNRNGGLIYDSDEKVETVWRKFADILLKASCRYVS